MQALPYDPNAVIDALANGLVILDHDLNIVSWNQWMTRYSGLPLADIQGKSLLACCPEIANSRLLLSIRGAVDHRFASLISPALHQQPQLRLYQVPKDKNHDRRMQQLIHILPLEVEGQQGCLLQIQDMTATVKRERRLRLHAEQLRSGVYLDPTTGLNNRKKFEESAAREFAKSRSDNTPISIIFADIDHFKAYNEHFGTSEGDAVLAKVGRLIRDSLRLPSDAIFRYGGEEFALLIPSTHESGVCLLAERLRLLVEAQHIPHSPSVPSSQITISLGVATVTNPEMADLDTLIQAVDMALYHAKTDGRNRAMCFSFSDGSIRACY